MIGEYLLIEIIVFVIALLVNYRFKLHIFKNPRRIFLAILASSIIFTPADIYAILSGWWGFNSKLMVTYVWIFPIEEILFILFIIPIGSIVFWELGKKVFYGI
jgi:lycopene cyclase domain-containing protein